MGGRKEEGFKTVIGRGDSTRKEENIWEDENERIPGTEENGRREMYMVVGEWGRV